MSGLRVIAGKARGHRLRSVPGDSTRPITDRTKESLFNILGPDVQGSSWLDLFAGTGSVGIEALSRGAAFVRFIDLLRQATETVKANLESTGLGQAARHKAQSEATTEQAFAGNGATEVLRMDAFDVLGRPADRAFDYVYIAPPQYKELWKRALLALDAKPTWLGEDAWVIVQIHPVEYAPLELQNLIEFEQRRYGSTLLIFYERK